MMEQKLSDAFIESAWQRVNEQVYISLEKFEHQLHSWRDENGDINYIKVGESLVAFASYLLEDCQDFLEIAKEMEKRGL